MMVSLFNGCGGGGLAPVYAMTAATLLAVVFLMVAAHPSVVVLVAAASDVRGSVPRVIGNTTGHPRGVFVEASGSILFTQVGYDSVQRLFRNGTVVPVAGSNHSGYANGIGTAASFNQPAGIAVRKDTNEAFVADSGNHCLRQINLTNRYVSEFVGSCGSSGTTELIHTPVGLALSDEGTVLYVADSGSNRILRVVVGNGSVVVYAGTGGSPSGSPSNGNRLNVSLCSPTGVAVGITNVMGIISGVSVIASSVTTVYVLESCIPRLKKIDVADGLVSVLSGNGTQGFADGGNASAMFRDPHGIAIDDEESVLYVADTGNSAVRAVSTTNGTVWTVSRASPGKFFGIACYTTTDYIGGLRVIERGVVVANNGNKTIAGIVLSSTGHTGTSSITASTSLLCLSDSATSRWSLTTAPSPSQSLRESPTGSLSRSLSESQSGSQPRSLSESQSGSQPRSLSESQSGSQPRSLSESQSGSQPRSLSESQSGSQPLTFSESAAVQQAAAPTATPIAVFVSPSSSTVSPSLSSPSLLVSSSSYRSVSRSTTMATMAQHTPSSSLSRMGSVSCSPTRRRGATSDTLHTATVPHATVSMSLHPPAATSSRTSTFLCVPIFAMAQALLAAATPLHDTRWCDERLHNALGDVACLVLPRKQDAVVAPTAALAETVVSVFAADLPLVTPLFLVLPLSMVGSWYVDVAVAPATAFRIARPGAQHPPSLSARGDTALSLRLNERPAYGSETRLSVLCACGGGAAASANTTTVTVAIRWPTRGLSTATQVTTGVASAASVAFMGDVAAGVSLAMVALLSCSGQPPTLSSTAYAISVFFDFGPVAMAAGNIGIVLLFALLHYASVRVFMFVKRRGGGHAVPTSSTAVDDPSTLAMASLHFPAVPILAAVFLLPGSVFGAASILSSSSSIAPLEWFVAIATVAAIVASLVAAQWALLYRVLPQSEYEAYTIPHPEAHPVEQRLLLPTSRWMPDTVRSQYGPLMGVMQRSLCGLHVCDTILALVLATITGIGVGSGGGACGDSPAVVAALYCLYAVVLVVLRPHRLPMDRVVCPMSHALFGAVCAVKYASNDEDRFDAATDAMQQALACLQLWRMLWARFVWYRELSWRRREASVRKQRRRRGSSRRARPPTLGADLATDMAGTADDCDAAVLMQPLNVVDDGLDSASSGSEIEMEDRSSGRGSTTADGPQCADGFDGLFWDSEGKARPQPMAGTFEAELHNVDDDVFCCSIGGGMVERGA